MSSVTITEENGIVSVHQRLPGGTEINKYKLKHPGTPFYMIVNAVRNALTQYCTPYRTEFDRPVTLQYENGFLHMCIAYAEDHGFDLSFARKGEFEVACLKKDGYNFYIGSLQGALDYIRGYEDDKESSNR